MAISLADSLVLEVSTHLPSKRASFSALFLSIEKLLLPSSLRFFLYLLLLTKDFSPRVSASSRAAEIAFPYYAKKIKESMNQSNKAQSRA